MPATRLSRRAARFRCTPTTRPKPSPARARVGLEWQEDAPELDTVLVAVGGGGLIAGIAAWYGRRVKVVGVEPEGSRCLHASLEAGRPVDVTVDSIAADSLGARNTGQLVFAIAQGERRSRRAGDGRRDRRGAAPALGSAAHRGRAGRRGRARGADQRRYGPRPDERVGVLLCGANVDPARLEVTQWTATELSRPPDRGLPRLPRRPPAAGAEPLSRVGRQGQSPEIMVIGCCDLRVSPEVIFDARPGRAVRRPQRREPRAALRARRAAHGVSAALEFGVQALKVKHIVVLGHGRAAACGLCRGHRAALARRLHRQMDVADGAADGQAGPRASWRRPSI